jgi:hypothetical protein
LLLPLTWGPALVVVEAVVLVLRLGPVLHPVEVLVVPVDPRVHLLALRPVEGQPALLILAVVVLTAKLVPLLEQEQVLVTLLDSPKV